MSALSLKISTRNPDLPVTSLPGPPVPPMSFSQIHLSNMQNTCKYYYTHILFFFVYIKPHTEFLMKLTPFTKRSNLAALDELYKQLKFDSQT